MNIQVLDTPDAVARKAAEFIAAEARTAVTARGRFVVAVSGDLSAAESRAENSVAGDWGGKGGNARPPSRG
jgi:hypothetical protein